MSKTIAFFGASGGVGLATLKHTLAAGHHCIALCRVPSKLSTLFPASTTPNLTIVAGNAHDEAAVSKCLVASSGKLVDTIVFTIGASPVMKGMLPSIDDPEVCQKGMATLVSTLNSLRGTGVAGAPHVIVCSTTGMSKFGRDIPLAMVPLYHVGLKVPHQDKAIMEERLVASGEGFTIIRPSLLVNGASDKKIRVGIGDPKTGRESKAIGYAISREDVGKWVAESLILQRDANYDNKIAMITW